MQIYLNEGGCPSRCDVIPRAVDFYTLKLVAAEYIVNEVWCRDRQLNVLLK